MVLIGYCRSEGEYQGYKFSNWKLHCVEDTTSKDFVGQKVTVLKVKSDLLPEPPPLGSEIQCFYDRYGNVCSIDVR